MYIFLSEFSKQQLKKKEPPFLEKIERRKAKGRFEKHASKSESDC